MCRVLFQWVFYHCIPGLMELCLSPLRVSSPFPVVFLNIISANFQSLAIWGLISTVQDLRVGVSDEKLQPQLLGEVECFWDPSQLWITAKVFFFLPPFLQDLVPASPTCLMLPFVPHCGGCVHPLSGFFFWGNFSISGSMFVVYVGGGELRFLLHHCLQHSLLLVTFALNYLCLFLFLQSTK